MVTSHLNNTKTISKVLICDDHPISQLGIKCALEEVFPNNIFQFFKASTGKEALQIAKKESLDLLILDLRLPDISGIEVLKDLKSYDADFKVMIMTSEENSQVLLQLLRYHVDAILLKSYTFDKLEAAVLHMQNNCSGELYLDPSLGLQSHLETEKQLLSPREFEVLQLLLKGLTNKAMAAILDCSPETVKAHRTKIREKTNLKNRDEISAWFYRGIEK